MCITHSIFWNSQLLLSRSNRDRWHLQTLRFHWLAPPCQWLMLLNFATNSKQDFQCARRSRIINWINPKMIFFGQFLAGFASSRFVASLLLRFRQTCHRQWRRVRDDVDIPRQIRDATPNRWRQRYYDVTANAVQLSFAVERRRMMRYNFCRNFSDTFERILLDLLWHSWR